MTSRLTGWYPPEILPVRSGVYEVISPYYENNVFRYFDADKKRWHYGDDWGMTVWAAHKWGVIDDKSYLGKWRGLAQDPDTVYLTPKAWFATQHITNTDLFAPPTKPRHKLAVDLFPPREDADTCVVADMTDPPPAPREVKDAAAELLLDRQMEEYVDVKLRLPDEIIEWLQATARLSGCTVSQVVSTLLATKLLEENTPEQEIPEFLKKRNYVTPEEIRKLLNTK